MDRTEASIAPARGGDRCARRRVPVVRMLAALVIVGFGLGRPWFSPVPGAAASARHPAAGPTLTLLAPPTIAGPSSPFALRLGVGGNGPRSALAVDVTVYQALSTATAFDETLGGTTVGSILTRTDSPIALSALPADSREPDHGVDLTIPVAGGGVAGTGSGPFTVDLHCSLGSCGGVYPVLLQLSDTASHTTTSHLLTYLTYTDPAADTERLRFALVLPLNLPPSSSAPGRGPSVDPGPATSAASLAQLTSVIGALSGPVSGVPLTLAPSAASLVALGQASGTKPKATLTSLLALLAQPDRQTLCGSFVPVDASALVGPRVGGMTELTEQIRRGDEVLGSQAGLHASCASGGPWVADSTLDASALAALSQLGYNELVIPPSAVTGPSLATTPTRRFTLTGTPATTSAILSDPQLSYLLQETAATDPGLAADQFLAELEFDYTEWPNTADPRGVVAAPPADWHADPTVLADVLAGLQDNPMVEPVTLSTLFADVPVGGTVGRFIQPSNHRPAAVSSATGFPAQAIATARAQLAGFTDSVSETPAGSAVATNLSDLLLESESRQLTAAQQRAAVVGFEQAIGKQLALLSITSRDARLTARTGSVPITVIKNAPYPVVAVLTLTSDKISFSAGGAQVPNAECRKPVVTTTAGTSRVSTQCTFIHGTNAVYIEMRSRVSGRFRMAVTLDSPATDLQLASGQLTVQSMSTSAVAIALSVAAIAVLLTWWGRTMWRTRKTRRGAHAQGADHS